MLRYAALVLLGVFVGACGKELPTLPIGLEFRSELPSQCPSDLCTDYGLDCGAMISVRVFPASTSPLEPGEPLTESCVQVPPSTNLCSVANAGLNLGDLPASRVRVEVAMWAPEVVGATCPSGAIFDLAGLPQSTFDPPPAFAGAKVINAGSDDIDFALIPLSCFDADPLGTCTEDTVAVTAEIDDLDTLLFAPALAAANLRVAIGVPQPQTGPSGTVFVIDAADDFELELARTVPVPQFEADVPDMFDATACLQVLDVAPQSTTAVTCTSLANDFTSLSLRGFLVNTTRVNQVLSSLGEIDFPSSGLVIGRVVDAINQPSGGATVTATTPMGGSAEVLYISEDFMSADATGPTASHGFFVSRVAPFGSRWTATHADSRIESSAPLTGLIEGKVTSLTIPLEP